MGTTIITGSPSSSPSGGDIAGLVPRPARSRRADVLTLADAVDRVLRSDEVNPSETRAVERAVMAVQSALKSFVSYSSQGFRYYDARHSINVSTSIPLTSVIVSGTTVTVSGISTFPSWMSMAHLRVDGQSYPVTSFTATSFEVDDTLPSGTYTTGCYLERLFYPLPQDFRRRGSMSDNNNYYPVIDVPGGILQSWQDYYDWARSVASPRLFGAITNDQRFQGNLMLAIWPPYQTEARINLFYERYPERCEVHRYGNGVVSTSGTTVTASGTPFQASHVGSILVFGNTSDTEIRNPLSSQDLVYESRVITSYSSGSQVSIDLSLTANVSGVGFYITDPVDVQPGAQEEAFLRLCEYEFVRQSRGKHARERYAEFQEAMNIAMADDSRYRPSMDDTDMLGDFGYGIGDVVGRPDLL